MVSVSGFGLYGAPQPVVPVDAGEALSLLHHAAGLLQVRV